MIHSATKFLGGHADALGGVVAGEAGLVEAIFRRREITGATLHADAAYLLLRGMKTLALRVERQNANALAIARHLRDHPGVARVFYPGLEDHPNHDVARRQMPGGFGGVLSFQLTASSRPSDGSCPGCAWPTGRRTWGRWRRWSPRRPPARTSS